MNQTRLLAATIVIALVIIVGFILSVPHTRDVAQVPEPEHAAPVPSVTLHDVFKKGTHTITGSLLASNACTNVTVHASLEGDSASSTKKNILVSLSLSTDTNVCLQLPTRINFKTTIVAPAGLPLSATVDGFAATTTSS